jgi:hypothetical protein
MKAFLEVEAGTRLARPEWVEAGEALAQEVAEAFHARGAFDEYNSPTYYGIDLHALSLWGERSSSARLVRSGRAIEQALWRDVGRWYHAGLRNLCGPYSRTYGMDMTRYMALLGLHVWAETGREIAPVPALTPDVDHGHDFFLGALTASLGARVPEDVRPALRRFPGEHAVAQEIARDPARSASGWLGPDLMIGAERNASDGVAGWEQYVAATVHWKLPDGGVGWIAARSLGPPTATASARCLRIELPEAPLRAGADPSRGRELRVRVHAPGLDTDALRADHLVLPGIEARITTDLTDFRVEPRDAGALIRFCVPEGRSRGELSLRFAETHAA